MPWPADANGSRLDGAVARSFAIRLSEETGRSFETGRNEAGHEGNGRDDDCFRAVGNGSPVRSGRQRRGADAACGAGAAGSRCIVLAGRVMAGMRAVGIVGPVGKRRLVERFMLRVRGVSVMGMFGMRRFRRCRHGLHRTARQHRRRGDSLDGKRRQQEPDQEGLESTMHFFSLAQAALPISFRLQPHGIPAAQAVANPLRPLLRPLREPMAIEMDQAARNEKIDSPAEMSLRPCMNFETDRPSTRKPLGTKRTLTAASPRPGREMEGFHEESIALHDAALREDHAGQVSRHDRQCRHPAGSGRLRYRRARGAVLGGRQGAEPGPCRTLEQEAQRRPPHGPVQQQRADDR